ncbi:MAG: AmmeMemoRadiSam system protein A [Desulfovibrionaceae bacterium]
MAAFTFSLSGAEQQFLMDVARLAILSALAGETPAIPSPPTERLREHLGAFVTLKINGQLRGCIGHLVGDAPLYATIAAMARSAAFEDPRFPPLRESEYEALSIELSVLSPITPCTDPEAIEVGRHGLLIQRGHQSGLLLPQVATEWGWNRNEFLDHTCRKAGLPPGAWRDPKARLFWFEAAIF